MCCSFIVVRAILSAERMLMTDGNYCSMPPSWKQETKQCLFAIEDARADLNSLVFLTYRCSTYTEE